MVKFVYSLLNFSFYLKIKFIVAFQRRSICPFFSLKEIILWVCVGQFRRENYKAEPRLVGGSTERW